MPLLADIPSGISSFGYVPADSEAFGKYYTNNANVLAKNAAVARALKIVRLLLSGTGISVSYRITASARRKLNETDKGVEWLRKLEARRTELQNAKKSAQRLTVEQYRWEVFRAGQVALVGRSPLCARALTRQTDSMEAGTTPGLQAADVWKLLVSVVAHVFGLCAASPASVGWYSHTWAPRTTAIYL